MHVQQKPNESDCFPRVICQSRRRLSSALDLFPWAAKEGGGGERRRGTSLFAFSSQNDLLRVYSCARFFFSPSFSKPIAKLISEFRHTTDIAVTPGARQEARKANSIQHRLSFGSCFKSKVAARRKRSSTEACSSSGRQSTLLCPPKQVRDSLVAVRKNETYARERLGSPRLPS